MSTQSSFLAGAVLATLVAMLITSFEVHAFSASSVSLFHGCSLRTVSFDQCRAGPCISSLMMRKQKASDRRTRRMQRGDEVLMESLTGPIRSVETVTNSPMASAEWQLKKLDQLAPLREKTAGRGRSRKRSTLYNSLSSYHSNFLKLLTTEYRAEEEEVVSRIKASVDDPLGLEAAGYALFDLFPERRGNIFADEVYRLVKANDACTLYEPRNNDLATGNRPADSAPGRFLPPNHKFSSNDVILLTLQPNGSGDFFGLSSLPTSSFAISVEARVLNTGPTYVDLAIPGGAFEAAFGPSPNNVGPSGRGDPRMRLRADRFFSNVPYTRMVSALSQITSIPEKKKKADSEGVASNSDNDSNTSSHDNICMDELLREAVLSTYAFNDVSSPMFRDMDACDLREMAKKLAKPPLLNSAKLAKQALTYIQSNPHGIFCQFNGPQLTAIEAALTRRLTLIQGPPGTGKTTVASSIAFGFVHQCRSISPNTKVLACAFSNVGSDNLAEQLVRLGLKVIRIGKASAVSESLWDYTLDAAIDKDPAAQKALRNAAFATAQLTRSQTRRKGTSKSKNSVLSERSKRDAATAAVKASIKACNIAATKALREADVIVSTSTGACDPRLLAACGIVTDDDAALEEDGRLNSSYGDKTRRPDSSSEASSVRKNAPDGLAPLSLPFVIVDEACQSVEPATLIPLTSTNSCRSLVLLGDPCQLPPTVRTSSSSPLSVSLMERLAANLPQPVVVTGQADQTEKDDSFLDSKPTKQALSLLRAIEAGEGRPSSYRKRFTGSLLLSVQYRMHPSISAFSSAIFYDGLLSTPTFLREQRMLPQVLTDELPCEKAKVGVRFIDVGGRANERRGIPSKFSRTVFTPSTVMNGSEEQTSYWNEEEAKHVVALVKKMLTDHNSSEKTYPNTIGVVTPYNGQVELIKSMLASDQVIMSLAQKLSVHLEVKSVDGYQGRERDVIIFSAVRSNRQGRVGFLADWRRMNVALTRAKSGLIVIGDIETLSEGDKHWAAFAKWCTGMKCILTPDATTEEAPPLS